jgi:hypothetical protein
MKKKILILYYSQSGQLCDVVHSIGGPLEARDCIEVVYECLRPVQPYPFPWPFLQFFDTFPETVYDDPPPILPLSGQVIEGDFDLIIIAYQVWFLSPAQPITAFLQSADSKRLLANKPVITVIACRNMWLMAQERMKQQLKNLGAHLIGNVVLTDRAGTAATFFSTPIWVLTGHKGPFFNGFIPEAGVSAEDIRQAARFGEALVAQLPARTAEDRSSMLSGLGAVRINENLIASERIAIRSFRIWGGVLRALGAPESIFRRVVLMIYVVFLIAMILTVVPITALLKRLTAPLMKQRSTNQRRYYAAPSGEEFSRAAPVND